MAHNKPINQSKLGQQKARAALLPDEFAVIGNLISRGEFERAITALQKHVAKPDPSHDALTLMGGALARLKRYDQAEYYFRKVAQLHPNAAPALSNLALILAEQGRPADAAPIYEQAFTLRGGLTPSNVANYAACLNTLHRSTEAAAFVERALQHIQADSWILAHYANALSLAGRIEASFEVSRQAVARDQGSIFHRSSLAARANYIPALTAEQIAMAHRACGQLVERSVAAMNRPLALRTAPINSARPTIGILSNDLREHAVTSFLIPYLRHADRAAFRLVAISTTLVTDQRTAELRPLFDQFIEISGVDQHALAERIARENIDVLIDLNGLTDGSHLSALALKPAPIQITYLGYPNTTGLSSVDYRITDSFCTPPGTESLFTEKPLRIDPTMHCFEPRTPAPVADGYTPPAAKNGFVTFASFSTTAKLNAPLLDLWAKVLAAAPTAKLVLSHHGFADPHLRAGLTAYFEKQGIEATRIDCRQPVKTTTEAINRYAEVDLVLDTFPYTGTTTVCEALTSGVPVISRKGETPAARVADSLLRAAGLPEYSTDSPEAYIALATKLAEQTLAAAKTNPTKLAQDRAALAAKVRSSPLCDGPAFAKRFEAAIRSVVAAAK
jgi:predicted O-linked N-acetylglucosamine transferase (SPINDLY family)